MSYDLVIKNGTVIDGSGLPRYRADIGVRRGRIATIGRIREPAREVIDADGQVVAPGFVDGHTHMDAQVFWDPLGTSSCFHGITTAVMGNCGFTLAPCAAADKHLVIRNLQRAEDIPPEAMEAGIDWRWTTFPEFLDCLEALPKGINYAGYIGHSALRTYVMGERAFEQPAGETDLRAMERELRDAIRAGAVGFTTSRSPSHETPDGRPVASRVASWDELRRLVAVLGELNAGIVELAGEGVDRAPGDPGLRDYHVRLRELAVESGRPDHLRRVQPARRAGRLARVPRPAGRDGGRGRPHVRAGAQPLAQLPAVVPNSAAIRPAAGVEGAARAPARRAAPAPAQPRAAPAAGRGLRGARRAPAGRHGGASRRLRLAVRLRHGGRTAPHGGGGCTRAWPASGRNHDRSRAREGPRPVLPAAARQRGPGLRAGADAPSRARSPPSPTPGRTSRS